MAADKKLQDALSFGRQDAQATLTKFTVDKQRTAEAIEELSMYFYTSNTPIERVTNPHLKRSFALLGLALPEPRDLRGSLLDSAVHKVRVSTLEVLEGRRYAIVTDGWSKRTASRGTPLINVMLCPDDGPAVAWRVEDASGCIKNTDYVVQLHQKLRAEIKAAVPTGEFLGYIMDSTATNRAAMQLLQEEDPAIIVLPCSAHAFSNLIKHTAKYFSWVNNVYDVCCSVSEKLIASQKLRSVLHNLQKEEYSAVRCICAQVPTRFGSRHMVMRDVLRSRVALRKLAAAAEWKAVVQESAAMKQAHSMITAADNDLFEIADQVEKLLGPVMDTIHQLEADQPMLSFLSGLWDNLLAHVEKFAADNPDLDKGIVPADKRKRNPRPTSISLAQLFNQDKMKMWHPAMTAAAVLDPVFWCKNARGLYMTPIAKLSEDQHAELDEVVTAFAKDGEDPEGEVTELEVSSFPERYKKVLDMLSKRVQQEVGNRTVVKLQPHTERADFFNNVLGDKMPSVTRAVNALLSMPVTSCSAERNWSRWGLTFVPNRNRLGIEQAEKLIFIQQNDPAMRLQREEDVLVE